jgi:cytochrome c553
MLNNHFPTVFAPTVFAPTVFAPTVFAALVALAAPTAPVHAAEQIAAVSHGIAPTGEREFGAKLLVCDTCHGAKGVPQNATIPVIWGQQENYLVKQLHDFQSGDRNFEAMAWMASTFSPSEMESAAAYFTKKGWPARSAGAAATTPPALAAVCQVCHQQNFVGGLAGPRLAGQSQAYLVEAMRRFADGERTNNADMMNLMKAIPPADREAMARYISSL